MPDIHKLIGKLPRPRGGFTLPNHKYTGPYNPLDQQLDEHDRPRPGQEPYNAVDAISMRHDICYRDHEGDKHGCDDKMLKELDALKPKGIREKVDRRLVRTLISAKRRLGLGVGADADAVSWSNELAKELHKPARSKFVKRKVYVKSVDQIWCADLVDMHTYSRMNRNYKYLLMVIDGFSKFGWVVPLKTKTGMEVAQAFSTLWKAQKPPQKLWVDKGKEFYNKHMETLMAKHHVEIYSTENEGKSVVVERWNRTMKGIMYRYFTANNTKKYLDILPAMINKYNNTVHRSIKCTPTAAREPANHQRVFTALYGTDSDQKKAIAASPPPKFQIGDRVRIHRKKDTFEPGFTPNWTEELFIIDNVKSTQPVTYTLNDTKGERIAGSFYEQELQKSAQEIYRIERVVGKRRRKDGVQEVRVKWAGYTKAFNSWIPIAEVQQQQ